MSDSGKIEPSYRVMQFTLQLDPTGTPRQGRRDLGRFDGIIEAFSTARIAALQTYTRLLKSAAGQAGVISFVDTEWGYDIRRESLVVERFWVHDREAAVLV